MSLLKSESYWHGVLVALFFAMTVSVMTAFVMTESATAFTPEGMRLWKPYQPEQFGGQRRDADGVYGSIDAIYWKVTPLTGIKPISTYPKERIEWSLASFEKYNMGESAEARATRAFLTEVLGAEKEVNTSSIFSNKLEQNFTLGTRITFGNRQGHWGWQFRGYGISDIAKTLSRNQVDWTTGQSAQKDPSPVDPLNPTYRFYTQAKIELVNERVTASSDIFDFELMGTYRTHPFKWGSMEFLAGAKYWDFADKFTYFNNNASILYYTETSIVAQPDSEDNVVLLYGTTLEKKVRNQIIGPQIGMNISRRNARWTFGADCFFIAGVNNLSYTYNEQSETSLRNPAGNSNTGNNNASGMLAPLSQEDQVRILTELNEQRILILDVFSKQNAETNEHRLNVHKKRTVFSPGVDLQLSAKWQWTDAVGFKLGFNSSMFNHIARSNDIDVRHDVYYIAPEDIYGNPQPLDDLNVREGITQQKVTTVTDIGNSHNTVITYGVSFGIEIRR